MVVNMQIILISKNTLMTFGTPEIPGNPELVIIPSQSNAKLMLVT